MCKRNPYIFLSLFYILCFLLIFPICVSAEVVDNTSSTISETSEPTVIPEPTLSPEPTITPAPTVTPEPVVSLLESFEDFKHDSIQLQKYTLIFICIACGCLVCIACIQFFHFV